MTTSSRLASERNLILALRIIAIVVGALSAWNSRFTCDADGVAYLDIGDAYFRGDWAAAINAYWSPLYSWLVGLVLLIAKPSSYWEFPLVHLVNFAIYIGSFICFEFFFREFQRSHKRASTSASENEAVSLPASALIALGYALFISSALALIRLKSVSPDLLLTAVVYLAGGMILRIDGGRRGWGTFALFGLVLGTGFLTKTAMFPISCVFLVLCFLVVGTSLSMLSRMAVTVLVFATISVPFIGALSRAKGRFTIGDTARYNYAYWVDGVAGSIHWQGDSVSKLQHPTREIFENPAAYEFGGDNPGSYPPWYDPTYWHEGLVPRFELKLQLRRIAINAIDYSRVLMNPSVLPIAGFLLLGIVSGWPKTSFKTLAQQGLIIVPALAAMAMYGVVHMETRYIGSYVVLLCLGVAAGIRFVPSEQSQKILNAAAMATALMVVLPLGFASLQSVAYEIMGKESQPHVQSEVADRLRDMGVGPGSKVAFLGDGFFEYWARLGRVQIVAEIPEQSMDQFWSASDSVKSELFEKIAATGAKVIVSGQRTNLGAVSGWKEVGHSGYYVRFLSQP